MQADRVAADLRLLRDAARYADRDRRQTGEPRLSEAARKWLQRWAAALGRWLSGPGDYLHS